MSIQSENAPTLCPRCVHFTKNADIRCKVGNYSLDNPDTNVQRWLREQSDESSWIYLGPCPRFQYNGSDPCLMLQADQIAFRKLLRVVR